MARKGGNPDIREIGKKNPIRKGEKERPRMGGLALKEKLERAKTMSEAWAVISQLPSKNSMPDGEEVTTTAGASIVLTQVKAAIGGDVQAAKFVYSLEPKDIQLEKDDNGINIRVGGAIAEIINNL